jgi:putative peptidoglycan lipid II flippase
MTLIRRLLDRVFPRGALILSVLSLGYFAMGVVRNRVLAGTYGLGPELDAYNAAFKIPEVALDVLVAAGLTAPFVPIFNGLRGRDEPAAHEFARTVLTVAVVVMTAVIVVLFIAAPLTVDLVGADFAPATKALYVELFRLMCVTPILFGATIVVGEVLVAHRQFLFYALAPMFYTGGIIVGTVLLHGRLGIHATALGAVGGAAAHLAIRSIGLFRTPFRIRPGWAIRTPAFREFIRLMLPRMVSHPIDPLMLTYFTRLASSVGVGAVGAFNFASDYQVVPVSLIGVSFSLAVFPTLAAAWAVGDGATFRRVLARNVATIGALTTLAALALAVLAHPLVELLLKGDKFGADDVNLTATVLTAYALSIPFDSLSYPLSRALYATHNTILQVAASLAGFATILAVGTALVGPVGIVAIPLAAAAGGAVKVGLLVLFLVPRLRRIEIDGPARTASELARHEADTAD